jgi:hypothetical protein
MKFKVFYRYFESGSAIAAGILLKPTPKALIVPTSVITIFLDCMLDILSFKFSED